MHIKIEETKQFVKDHKTTLALSATAVVAYKLGYRFALKGAIEGVTDVAYEWGHQAGMDQLHLAVFYHFIEEKGLQNELLAFAKTVVENELMLA